MNRAFPNGASPSEGRVSHTLSATVEEWLAPALPEEDLRLPHPILSAQADPRPFLESHRDGVVIALDWPVILEAAELTRLGRHRDLLELDRNYPARRAGQWTEASFRVGRRQLSRLKVCRDLRVVQRYLGPWRTDKPTLGTRSCSGWPWRRSICLTAPDCCITPAPCSGVSPNGAVREMCHWPTGRCGWIRSRPPFRRRSSVCSPRPSRLREHPLGPSEAEDR